MWRRSNSSSSAGGRPISADGYDHGLDDRIHNVHRRDESDAWLAVQHFGRRLRRSPRTVSIAGCLTLLYVFWTFFYRPRYAGPDWSRFAYVQYAVDDHNLCNALMVFESLHRYGSKAQRVLLHHPQWATQEEGGRDKNAELLSWAVRRYGVSLRPVQILDSRGEISQVALDGERSYWDTSVTKLRAFELTEFKRLIVLDSDVTLFAHVDELFLLPSTPVAMPRAYWFDSAPREAKPLTSMLIVLEPNPDELKHFVNILKAWRRQPDLDLVGKYDMDLLNHRFGESALVIPHRPYALLSGEFRSSDHNAYLGTTNAGHTPEQAWKPVQALKEAKIVHFSDWPLPKPWMMWPDEGLQEMQPDCKGTPSCRERDIWIDLYEEFRDRRIRVCRVLPVRAPDWEEWKHAVGSGEVDDQNLA